MVSSSAKKMYTLIHWSESNEATVMSMSQLPSCSTTRDPSKGQVVPFTEGSEGYFIWPDDNLPYWGKIMRLSENKGYLKALRVLQDGTVLGPEDSIPKGSKVAKQLSMKTEKRKTNAAIKKSVKENEALVMESFKEVGGKKTESSDAPQCNHNCPKCCNSKSFPFPQVPPGFRKALNSLLMWFEENDKDSPADESEQEVKDNWWKPSLHKRELKKNSGVWIDRQELKRLVAETECSVGDKASTLFKKLMKHLLGEEEFTGTKPCKIHPTVFSAVMGFVNNKYQKDVAEYNSAFYSRVCRSHRLYLLGKAKRKNDKEKETPSDSAQDLGDLSIHQPETEETENVEFATGEVGEKLPIGTAGDNTQSKKRRRKRKGNEEASNPSTSTVTSFECSTPKKPNTRQRQKSKTKIVSSPSVILDNSDTSERKKSKTKFVKSPSVTLDDSDTSVLAPLNTNFSSVLLNESNFSSPVNITPNPAHTLSDPLYLSFNDTLTPHSDKENLALGNSSTLASSYPVRQGIFNQQEFSETCDVLDLSSPKISSLSKWNNEASAWDSSPYPTAGQPVLTAL